MTPGGAKGEQHDQEGRNATDAVGADRRRHERKPGQQVGHSLPVLEIEPDRGQPGHGKEHARAVGLREGAVGPQVRMDLHSVVGCKLVEHDQGWRQAHHCVRRAALVSRNARGLSSTITATASTESSRIPSRRTVSDAPLLWTATSVASTIKAVTRRNGTQRALVPEQKPDGDDEQQARRSARRG